jgi:hypothetical protein
VAFFFDGSEELDFFVRKATIYFPALLPLSVGTI